MDIFEVFLVHEILFLPGKVDIDENTDIIIHP